MDKANIGDKIQLTNQEVEVVASDKGGIPMVNVDLNKLAKGDLGLLKKKGVSISDSSKEGNLSVTEEFADHAVVEKPTLGHKIAAWFGADDVDSSDSDSENNSSDDDSDDDSSSHHDDSSFFDAVSGGFLGGLIGGEDSGGFGGFGGFGGGGFSGGGASAGF